MSELSFAELGLDPAVLEAVTAIGYETPTPIQAQSIPALLAGKHLLGVAQTGTGKTAAFALPLLSRIDATVNEPQILVLAPTRELALQVAEAFTSYATKFRHFYVLPIYGGQDFYPQIKGLRRGAQVIVGTPGRMLDHLRKGTLQLGNLKALVLDEADEMLRMGFIDDVEAILSKTPDDCQRALFSATMPPQIKKVAKTYLHDAVEVKIESETRTVKRIAQFVLPVYAERKLDALTRILEVEPIDAAIIFVRTKVETTMLAEKLSARGHAVAPLNGDLNQRQREQTVEDLKRGKKDIIVATDVAARGLDVPRISHVINYDVPYDTEAYIHRVGRTGRAGREGKAILLVTPRERSWLRTLERATNSPMEPYELPSPDELKKMREEQFETQLLGFAEDKKLAKAMSLLDDIAERKDMDMAMLAGALACWMEASQPGSLPLEQPEALPKVSATAPRRDHKGGKGRPGEHRKNGKGAKGNFRKGPPKGRSNAGSAAPRSKAPGKGGNKPVRKRPARQD
jgi:ATP-dependent RNA helicase DeaD